MDFTNGVDKLDLRGLAGSFAEAKAAAKALGDHVVFQFGADRLEVFGLTLKTLSADDFLF